TRPGPTHQRTSVRCRRNPSPGPRRRAGPNSRSARATPRAAGVARTSECFPVAPCGAVDAPTVGARAWPGPRQARTDAPTLRRRRLGVPGAVEPYRAGRVDVGRAPSVTTSLAFVQPGYFAG